MKRKNGVIFGAVLVLTLNHASLSVLPTLEHITDPGLDLATAGAVSSRGSVIVGQAVKWEGQSPEELIYHFDKSYDVTSEIITTLGAMPQGGRAFRATAVSGNGAVVSGITGGGVAYRWEPETGDSSLIWNLGNVTDISNDGSVIIGTSGPFAGIIYWWENNILLQLDPPAGFDRGIPYGINGAGTIMVGGCWNLSGEGGGEAFLYTTSGMSSLGKPEGHESAAAHDVNHDGSVIVGTSIEKVVLMNDQEVQRKRALLFKDATITILDMGEHIESEAIGVSGDGARIVGHVRDTFFRWFVAIWERQPDDSYMLQLANDLFADTESSLKTATAISEDGTTIVGSGSFNGVDGIGRLRLDVTPWEGAAMDADSSGVDPIQESAFGTVNIQFDPWWYSYTLETYIYASEEAETDQGGWFFIPAPAGP